MPPLALAPGQRAAPAWRAAQSFLWRAGTIGRFPSLIKGGRVSILVISFIRCSRDEHGKDLHLLVIVSVEN